jgi:predicted RecB family nuclease
MGLKEQRGATKEIIGDFLESLGPQLAIIKKTVEKQHGEMENAFAQFEQKEKNLIATIMEQKNELAEIRLKLEKLESSIFEPEPLLESQSNVADIKGIGHGKAAKLKEIGITNVGEFITAESKVVAEGMGSSERTVEKLQGRAQLSLVPGLKKKYLFLLEGVNVRDRNSLSEQDPIELSKKINTIFEANVAKRKISPADKPTIEEIDSWVKFSRC